MREPRIAFCTTAKGRTEHVKQTLPKNLADNEDYRNAVFVVLDYGDKDGLLDYLKDNHRDDIASGRVVVYSHLRDGPFHVSHAKNIAARCGIMEGADLLVTVDADNYTGPNFARFVADNFRDPGKAPGIFLCPDYPLIHSLPHGPERPERGYAGRLAIRAMDFIKFGGYDETFDTWRGEDIDLISRLQRVGYTMRHIDNCYLRAIAHNAEVRFKEYPHAKQYENKQEVQVIYARKETVVNFGNAGVGTVYRNRFFPERAHSSPPIELTPFPTRIFGIGMHKTATSALHIALQILGLDSFHWGSGEAPRIWNEMESAGRSRTLEQWYALSDLPIPLLYEKLDRSYPGSKFILTIRNETDWLKSVERLWDPRYNPTRWIWDAYPFTNRIHTALYGQKHFDPSRMLATYRWHNESVREYFHNRPADLLEMDMDAGDGWQNLCGFLGVPVPLIPYPAKNLTPLAPLAKARYKSWVKAKSNY